MQISRRKFTRGLVIGAATTSLVAESLAQSTGQSQADSVDIGMKVIDVQTSPKMADEIRAALKNTAKQVAAIRAYPLKRDTQPALALEVFDA